MTATKRADGSVLIEDGLDAVLVTPALDKALIITTGKTDDHPFDAVPILLERKAAFEFYLAVRGMVT